MRLLNTKTARLTEFTNPDKIPPYAILSHVWQQDEQTFQDVQHLRDSDDPRARVSDKIRNCCLFAEQEGFEWVWIDTCCIDKTSSSELSEAINSMYAWYASAAVCYVWMHDVDDKHPSRDKSFLESVWFTRGWTLQELIAPSYVVFLSQRWHTLGTKHTLAHRIEHVTGIDCDVLLRAVEPSQISVARRMFWASSRHTTREEDRAYSLMGIFDVHMPTIYGEGSNAFTRLQIEILKQCPDQSIFAWGRITIDYDAINTCSTPVLVGEDLQRELETPRSLLASSPSDFAHSAGISPIPFGNFADLIGQHPENIIPPEYSHTSYGMRTSLPLVHYTSTRDVLLTFAILACQDSKDNLIILLLHQRRRDASMPYLYSVGAGLRTIAQSLSSQVPSDRTQFHRVATLHRSSLLNVIAHEIKLLNLYINYNRQPPHHPPRKSISDSHYHPPVSYAFFFPAWLLQGERIMAVSDEHHAPHASTDGLMLEVFPGPHAQRAIIFARDPSLRDILECEAASPLLEGFRFSVVAQCSCRSGPLQHPMSLSVDIINPAFDHGAVLPLPQHRGPAHGRARSLSNLLRRDEQFVQMMLRTQSMSSSNPDPNFNQNGGYESDFGGESEGEPSGSPTYGESGQAWVCASKRTHLPTISNPYVRLKFFSAIGRVDVTLKRWEGCHKSKATYVYFVDLKMVPSGQPETTGPERQWSLPSYTEGVIPESGLILYDPVREQSTQNALRLDNPAGGHTEDEAPRILIDYEEAAGDETEDGGNLSPLASPLVYSPLLEPVLDRTPSRSHSRRHSSPNLEPYSPATTYYTCSPASSPLPRSHSRHGSWSPYSSPHPPPSPSPFLSPYSSSAPGPSRFSPSPSPHRSPRPSTSSLPPDSGLSHGVPPQTPVLQSSPLPSPSVLSIPLEEAAPSFLDNLQPGILHAPTPVRSEYHYPFVQF